MTAAFCIGLVPVVVLLLRVAFAITSGAWRLGAWLVEQPEGLVGATGRLVVLGLLLHTIGLL